MMIDSNMYWLPEELFTNQELADKLLSAIPKEFGWYGYLEEIKDSDKKQFVLEKPKGYQNLNYVQGDYSLEQQLADMDEAGVDKAILKLPGCQEWLSLELCRSFNDAVVKHAKDSRGRLIPLAIVPPYSKKENLEELERCHKELGMKAIQLSAHYGDKYLDDEAFAGFFEILNELHMTAYVHHTPVPVEYQSFYEYNNVRRSYGRCVDQGLAVGRELFSGFFDKYPNIKMVHSMLGGGFFAIANLLFPNAAKIKEDVGRFHADNNQILKQFKENIYFETSHAQPWGEKQLECAVEVLGADHIIFGSSYPVRREWLTQGPAFIKALDLTEEEKELILSENAMRLYGID